MNLEETLEEIKLLIEENDFDRKQYLSWDDPPIQQIIDYYDKRERILLDLDGYLFEQG